MDLDMPSVMIDPVHFASTFRNNYAGAKRYFEHMFFKVNNPAVFIYFDNVSGIYHIKNLHEMLHITNNLWYIYTDDQNIEYRCKFFQRWLDDPRNLTYSHMKLVPRPLVCGARVLNLFNGFYAEKMTPCEPVSIQIILDHVKLLCEDSAEYANYFLDFLAHILQKPAQLTRTALVFKGSQGAGKGVFFTWFANKILGSKYYRTSSVIDTIVKHNDHLNGKFMVTLDEADPKDTYTHSQEIKTMITEPIITLSNKYIRPFPVENYCRYIFLSTNDNPVKVEPSDKRFVIYKTSDRIARLPDRDPVKINYFRTLLDAMNNSAIAYTFYRYLMDRNIEQVNWDIRPITDSYNQIRELNIPIFADFLESYCWETDTIPFSETGINTTTKAQFFTEFTNFIERTRSESLTMKERYFQIECKRHSFIKSVLVGEARHRRIQIDRRGVFNYLRTNNYLKNPAEEYNMD